MKSPRSTRVARALADHPPTLDPSVRARMEESLVEAARRRSLSSARTREELADLLAAAPPALDASAKLRLEDALVAARRDQRARLVQARVAVGALVVAAAAGIALLGPRAADAPAPRAVASPEDGVTVVVTDAGRELESGPVTAPRAFASGPAGAVRLAQGASSVDLASASRATLVAASRELLALELASGAVSVAFHPARPGEQGLFVDTPRARVEVVGTVFRVAVGSDGATAVFVTEGVVRVVEREGGASHLVRAGESIEIMAPPVAALGSSEAGAPRARAIGAGAPSEHAALAPGAPGWEATRLGPEARFAEAERLFDRERFAEARALLRPLSPGAPATAARALTLTAESFAREGDLAAAAAAYAAAAQRGEGTTHGANAWYALGRLSERQRGDAVAARHAYASYLEALPDGPLAEQARRALCRLGDAPLCE